MAGGSGCLDLGCWETRGGGTVGFPRRVSTKNVGDGSRGPTRGMYYLILPIINIPALPLKITPGSEDETDVDSCLCRQSLDYLTTSVTENSLILSVISQRVWNRSLFIFPL